MFVYLLSERVAFSSVGCVCSAGAPLVPSMDPIRIAEEAVAKMTNRLRPGTSPAGGLAGPPAAGAAGFSGASLSTRPWYCLPVSLRRRGRPELGIRERQPPRLARRAVRRLEPDGDRSVLDALDPAAAEAIVDHVAAGVPAGRLLLLRGRLGGRRRRAEIEQVLLHHLGQRRDADAEQADAALDVDRREQAARDVADHGLAVRRPGERGRARDGGEVVAAHLERDGAAGALAGPQPRGHAPGQRVELGAELDAVGEVGRERVLDADRLELAIGHDRARVEAPGELVEPAPAAG